MKSVLGGYERPGLTALTVVPHPDDLQYVEGWLDATLPYVEQAVLVFIEAVPPPALLTPHSRIRILTFGQSHWKWFERMTQYHDALARLAEHQWSLFLDIYRRVTPEEFRSVRNVCLQSGPYSSAIRFSDNLVTRANTYRNRLWRTNWDLRVDESGELHSLHGTQCDTRGILTIDELAEYEPQRSFDNLSQEVQSLAKTRLSCDAPVLITGMHRAGTSMVARMVNLLGVNLGTNLLGVHGTPDPTNPKGHWEDIGCIDANKAIIRDAIDYQTEWEWANAVQVQHDSLSPTTHTTMQEAVAPLKTSGRWGFKDPRNCVTLRAWCAELGRPAIVVGCRNPIDVARSLYNRNSLPFVDGLRLWVTYYRALLETVADLKLATIFVEYEEVLEDPCTAFTRLGDFIQAPASLAEAGMASVRDFVDPKLRHNRSSYPSTEKLGELFGEQALESEIQELQELYGLLQNLSKLPAPPAEASTPKPPTNTSTVIVRHTGDPKQLSDFCTALLKNQDALENSEFVFLVDGTHESKPSLPRNIKGTTIALGTSTSGLALREVVDKSPSDVVIFTRSSTHSQGDWLRKHMLAHTSVDFPVALSGQETLAPSIAACPVANFMADLPSCTQVVTSYGNHEPMPGDQFPATFSVSRESILRCGNFSPELGHGAEFVDLVSRLQRIGTRFIDTNNISTQRVSGTTLHEALDGYHQFSTHKVALFSKYPLMTPTQEVRKNVEEAVLQVDKLGALRTKLPDLTRSYLAQRAPNHQLLGKLKEHYQTAFRMTGTFGYLTSDPRVVRHLGRPMAQAAAQRVGELWSGHNKQASAQRILDNQNAVEALRNKHQDDTIFIMGCSPQLNELTADQLQLLSKRVTIGVNDSFYRFVPQYLLSSYIAELTVAHKRHRTATTIIHARPYIAAPLLEGTLTVARENFAGELTQDFGESLRLFSKANVVLLASHLAAIMGARRIAYIGVEMKTLVHYYQSDPSYIPTMRQAFREDGNSPFLGMDHAYVRPPTMLMDKLVSAERMQNQGSRFDEYNVVESMGTYFDELRRLGIDVCVTTQNSRLVECDATVTSLDALLEESP